MHLRPLDIRSGVSIEFSYSESLLPSPPHMQVLVVRFTGSCQIGSACTPNAVYMDAMIRAGIAVWSPAAVVLDLRELVYEWGDMMVRPLAAGSDYYVDGDLPLAAIVSDLNREGLTSLVAKEMQADPATLLFASLEDAIQHLDQYYPPVDLQA